MGKDFRGPESGYNSDAKEEYRNYVWSAFKDSGVIDTVNNVDDAFVLLLPSKEGQEIETAIRFGVPEHKIVAVDENPAMIAVSAWRKRRPDVKFYGCKISDVGKKLKKDGIRIIAANLDLCSNFSDQAIYELESFFEETPRYYGYCFAITIMKGREGSALAKLLNKQNNNMINDVIDSKRLAAYFTVSDYFEGSNYIPINIELVRQGCYTHSRVKMEFAVFRHIPKSEVLGIIKHCYRHLVAYEMLYRRKMAVFKSARHEILSLVDIDNCTEKEEEDSSRILDLLDRAHKKVINKIRSKSLRAEVYNVGEQRNFIFKDSHREIDSRWKMSTIGGWRSRN